MLNELNRFDDLFLTGVVKIDLDPITDIKNKRYFVSIE